WRNSPAAGSPSSPPAPIATTPSCWTIRSPEHRSPLAAHTKAPPCGAFCCRGHPAIRGRAERLRNRKPSVLLRVRIGAAAGLRRGGEAAIGRALGTGLTAGGRRTLRARHRTGTGLRAAIAGGRARCMGRAVVGAAHGLGRL